MKYYLLDASLPSFKANLHCHSTYSDGRKTPEELKQLYKSRGYSVIAFTDHDLQIPHPDLDEEDFLSLTGYEMEINEEIPDSRGIQKTCHLCFIAPKQTGISQVCYHRSQYLFGNANQYRPLALFNESLPDYVREYSPVCINDMIRIGKDAGYFITYNHPAWSRESYPSYSTYQGMDAMEIINYGCTTEGHDDHNEWVYEDLLHLGNRLFCIAADDNHNFYPDDSLQCDSCGAWTMIQAPSLSYENIFASLQKGAFYASEGPSIEALWLEDGKIHIQTSPAAKIVLLCGARTGGIQGTIGEIITEAVFDLHLDYRWFRLEVWDTSGKKAYSNAVFTEDLPKDLF